MLGIGHLGLVKKSPYPLGELFIFVYFNTSRASVCLYHLGLTSVRNTRDAFIFATSCNGTRG